MALCAKVVLSCSIEPFDKFTAALAPFVLPPPNMLPPPDDGADTDTELAAPDDPLVDVVVDGPPGTEAALAAAALGDAPPPPATETLGAIAVTFTEGDGAAKLSNIFPPRSPTVLATSLGS